RLCTHAPYLPCVLAFLLHCLSSPLVPPSIPTRHSSDLYPDTNRFPQRPPLIAATLPAERFPDRDQHFNIVITITATGRVAAINGDRKSTRLNSSHGSITYAVFCLKKKNRQIARTTE